MCDPKLITRRLFADQSSKLRSEKARNKLDEIVKRLKNDLFTISLPENK